MAETLGNSLARRIGDEIALLRDFVAVLEREQKALNTDDADGIASSSEAKLALLQQLGQISTERNLALARAGFASDRAGLDAFLSGNVDSGALVQLRERLLAVAGEANELNRINGKLIRARAVRNQKHLSILLGSGEAASTYGRDGRSNLAGKLLGRRLTTA